jgi:hypothetical protein
MATQSERTDLKRSSNLTIIVMSMSALFSAYALGIWLGLWNTYRDANPSWGRVHFALIITAIPLLLPFIMTIVSIPMLQNQLYKPVGVILLVCSIVFATLIGVIIVPMGNF